MTILHSQTEAFPVFLCALFLPRLEASEIDTWAQAIYTGLQEGMRCHAEALVSVENWRSWETYTLLRMPHDYP